jgi:DNA-binding transcriptional ArsR family regulator
MPKPDADFSSLSGLDRMVYEPARLAILATLAGCESADFEFLLRATGLNKGNLSAHAIKLESAGYLEIRKGFRGRVPYTQYSITKKGSEALKEYQENIRSLLGRLKP